MSIAKRPRLSTLLLLVNLFIICLPLGGIAVLRLYESALIRQTESELIAQGAFVAAMYRATLQDIRSKSGANQAPYGLPMKTARRLPFESQAPRWRPRPARLDLALDPIAPRPPLAISTALRSQPAATAAGKIMMPIMREAQLVTLAGIRILDPQGIVVASTGQELNLLLTNRQEVRRVLQGQAVSVLRRRISDEAKPPVNSISRGAGLRVFVLTPIFQQGRIWGAVVLSRTPRTLGQALHGKRVPLAYAAFFLLLAALLISLFTSLTINRPIRAVIRQTQRAIQGERGAVQPLRYPVTEEIAQLSGSVAIMARTLEQRADYLCNFASQVSHAFKSPLTAIRGALELLREHGAQMSLAERDGFFANLEEDAVRLERLLNALLALARAEAITLEGETVEVVTVLQALASHFQRQGLAVSLQCALQAERVAMARETLDSLLSSLLENVQMHAGQGVQVILSCSEEAVGNERQVVIQVADNGPGIPPANAQRIFEPFFSTALDRGGTGLGLALVQSLLSAHQGSICLVAAKQGTVFEIRLPLSV